MKNSIYILVLGILTLASCSLKEEFPLENGQDGCVEFVVRPSSFNVCNVSSPQTKSAYTDPTYTGDQLTALEKKIVNAYFLIFRPDGQLYQPAEELTVTNSVITEYPKIQADAINADITACFVANVPESYINSIENINDLSTKPLPLEYASYESTGYVGIPSLNGTPCFPMFGMYIGPLTTDKPQVQISLKRLFSKMEFNLRVDMTPGIDWNGQDVGLSHSAEANFTLFDYTISNLPKQILLTSKTSDGALTDVITESPWGDNPAGYAFMDNQNVNFGSATPQIFDKDNVLEPQATKELYTFYCYVPEYVLLPNGNEDDYSILTQNRERFKPLLFDEGQKPIYLTLEGRLAQQNGSFSNVRYEVYLGENNFDSFSMFRNNLYRNNLTIGGADHLNTGDDSKVDHRVDILPLNLVETYGQSANCYIISLPGTYEIDTYKGVVKTLSSAAKLTGKSASVLWNTNSNNTITASLSENKTKVILNVNATSSNAVEPGNALVALYGDDGILWSWHIWFCADNNRADKPAFLERYVDDSGNYNNKQVMNRALGATNKKGVTIGDYDLSIWDDGLYYQWGRKDPVTITGSVTTGTGAEYNDATKNPTIFYTDWTGNDSGAGWGSAKSVNDPCPPGFRVPSSDVWKTSNPDALYSIEFPLFGEVKLTDNDRYTYNLTRGITSTDGSTFILFPYNGNYDSAGVKQDKTLSSVQSYAGITVTCRVPSPNTSVIDVTKLYPAEYRNITFRYDESISHGTLWAADKKSLTYGYSAINKSGGALGNLFDMMEIVTCERRQGTSKTSGPWYNTRYTGEVEWGAWETINGSDLGLLDIADESSVSSKLKEYLQENGISTESYVYKVGTDLGTATALQVRCVKE